MKKLNRRHYIIMSIVAVVLLFLIFGGKKKHHEISFTTEKATVGNIQNNITATGTIEPVTSVTIGTQVSGIVSKLYVDYNSVVRRGQVIAELDKTNLMSQLNTARANLSSVQSSLNYQSANYKRYQTLYEKGLVSADEYETAQLSYRQAKEQVASAREEVQRAQTNLGYATITSPIDGIVLSKSVEEGQTVAASFSTPELFKIAQDLTNMQVVADIDEADIGGVKEGQRVTFTVDAFPDDTFEGFVRQVRQEATTESNVVTYQVIISAPNNDLKLKPGLTANVTIYTMEKNNVLTIPSKALRFTPNEAILQKGQTIQDCEGTHKVWTREGNVFKAHSVQVGITNGVLTEITAGIKPGTEVLLDFSMPDADNRPDNKSNGNPFMPKRRDNKKDTNKK